MDHPGLGVLHAPMQLRRFRRVSLQGRLLQRGFCAICLTLPRCIARRSFAIRQLPCLQGKIL